MTENPRPIKIREKTIDAPIMPVDVAGMFWDALQGVVTATIGMGTYERIDSFTILAERLTAYELELNAAYRRKDRLVEEINKLESVEDTRQAVEALRAKLANKSDSEIAAPCGKLISADAHWCNSCKLYEIKDLGTSFPVHTCEVCELANA